MRMMQLLAGAAVLLATASAAGAASRQDRNWCADGNTTEEARIDRNIAACDRVLKSAKEKKQRALALANRCTLLNNKEAYDRALQDCEEAIRLDPKPAFAYTNRGRAFDGKGEADRAMADFDEAIKRDPRQERAYTNRGRVYLARHEYDRAIAALNEAVKIDPKQQRTYFNRGVAYANKGEIDRAIADFDQAIRLNPKSFDAYSSRGRMHVSKGEYERAIADFTEAARVAPKPSKYEYFGRGLAHFDSGALAKALADFEKASELDPKNAYVALWIDIAAQRGGAPGRLAQAVGNLDMTAWPAPIVRMFMGELTPAALLAAADDPDAIKKLEKICEANYYSGVLALRQSAKDEGTRLFRLAASDCPKDFDEFAAARAELKALGVTP
jgi:lipoprotein NlpI